MGKFEIILWIIWYDFGFYFISMVQYSYIGDILDDIYDMLATYTQVPRDK